MANDKQWQRRSDEWVKMTHESRRQKEAEHANQPQSDNPDKADDKKSSAEKPKNKQSSTQSKPSGKAHKR